MMLRKVRLNSLIQQIQRKLTENELGKVSKSNASVWTHDFGEIRAAQGVHAELLEVCSVMLLEIVLNRYHSGVYCGFGICGMPAVRVSDSGLVGFITVIATQ
jgi:hypothetical protein